MAAQVLSGTGNVSYTNSTGQNVRIVINYLENDSHQYAVTMTFQGVTVNLNTNSKIGKSLAWESAGPNQIGEHGYFATGSTGINAGVPTEIALSNGETFSLSIPGPTPQFLKYNVIIIPEAG